MRIFPELTVDQEFETLGASGATGALNDRQFTYLKNIGYTQASLPDAISEFRNFNPVSLFNSTTNARGFFYDFSDYSTQFTNTAGTTSVSGPGQSLALVLDKSQGMALGSELFGGTFITSVAGGTATATENPSGTLNITGDGTNQARGDFSFSTVAGKTYRLTATVSGSAASVVVGTSQGSNSIISGILLNPGNISFVFVATSSTTWVRYFKTGAILSSLSATSVRELAGNHATQGTAGSQPLTVIRPLSVERRNFAIGSGDVGGSSLWISPASNNGITVTRIASGIDADGLPYNDWTVTGTASATSTVAIIFGAPARVAATTGQQFTCSARVQVIAGTAPSAGNGFRPSIDGETAPTTFVEFGGGTPIAPTSETLASTTYTLANALSNQARGTAAIVTASGLTVNYTIRIKALQFELGSTRTTYQRVITANEWYQEGLQSYRGIQTDGVDDFMQTAAIDFSNSDEVTVVVGVRTIGTANAVLTELEVGPTVNSFSIRAPLGANGEYLFRSQGAFASDAISSVNPIPNTSVISGIGKISTDTSLLRRNGVQVAQNTADQGTGNYSNAIVYLFRRGGTSLPANVICTFMMVINRVLTSEELARLEAYVNSRTGAY